MENNITKLLNLNDETSSVGDFLEIGIDTLFRQRSLDIFSSPFHKDSISSIDKDRENGETLNSSSILGTSLLKNNKTQLDKQVYKISTIFHSKVC